MLLREENKPLFTFSRFMIENEELPAGLDNLLRAERAGKYKEFWTTTNIGR